MYLRDVRVCNAGACLLAAMFDMSRDMDIGVTLYSRKIMIMNRANHILPRWLRFLKG